MNEYIANNYYLNLLRANNLSSKYLYFIYIYLFFLTTKSFLT